MRTLTAIIRAKAGHAEAVRAALIRCGESVRAEEPRTLGFSVHQDPADPCVLVTWERFADEAALEAHNAGPASRGFFAAAGDLLDGPVTVVIADEIFQR